MRRFLSSVCMMLCAFTACSDESNPVTNESALSSSSISQTSDPEPGINSSEAQEVYSSSSVEPGSATSVEPCRTDEADNCKYESVADDRDGKVYKTVKIGNLWWTAENISYKTEKSYCYGDEDSNCAKYGRLYKWDDAVKACPNGWRLPTKNDFEDLFVAVGGRLSAGQVLKSTSGWKSDGNGRDAYGFSALPAGYMDEDVSGLYSSESSHAFFWSSTVSEHSDGSAFNMYLNYSTERKYPDGSYDEAHLDTNYKRRGLSVRCVKD